jgi:hypothetical protein
MHRLHHVRIVRVIVKVRASHRPGSVRADSV